MQQPLGNYPSQIPADQLRSGIIFGPGRTTRLPEKGTPEYQQMVNRLRSAPGQSQ